MIFCTVAQALSAPTISGANMQQECKGSADMAPQQAGSAQGQPCTLHPMRVTPTPCYPQTQASAWSRSCAFGACAWVLASAVRN